MVELTRAEMFLKEAFRSYYTSRPPSPPERFTLREYAYFSFGSNMMIRHIALRSLSGFQNFFVDAVPQHVYYSTAFYRQPDLTPMEEKIKGWLGAELIFDLDSDHLPGAEKLTYQEQLIEVKKYFKRLIDDFILSDLGFSEDFLRINFSGGRGYHLHVVDPRVIGLDSHQRREIVDYITGKGIDPESLIIKSNVRVGRGRYEKEKVVYRLPGIGGWGWGRKLRKAAENLFSEIAVMDEEEAVHTIYELSREAGWGRKRARNLYNLLFGPGGEVKRSKILVEGVLDVLSDQYRKGLIHILKEYAAVKLGGETDEPVTTDTRRIIRIPGSLHGKSGFQATPLTLEELDDFDPLVDAVVLPEKPDVKVIFRRRASIRLKDFGSEFDEGETAFLPLYAAVFAVGIGAADVP